MNRLQSRDEAAEEMIELKGECSNHSPQEADEEGSLFLWKEEAGSLAKVSWYGSIVIQLAAINQGITDLLNCFPLQ